MIDEKTGRHGESVCAIIIPKIICRLSPGKEKIMNKKAIRILSMVMVACLVIGLVAAVVPMLV